MPPHSAHFLDDEALLEPEPGDGNVARGASGW